MTGPELICTVERDAPIGLVRLAGTLDVTTAPEVRTALLKCLTSHPDTIVLDVSGMTVADDVALSVFLAMSRHASGWPGTTLALAAPGPVLLDALERMAVRRFLPTFPSVAEALADDVLTGSVPRLRQWLEPVPDSLANARALVAGACRIWVLPELLYTAELIVTELVSNVVRHARTEMQVSLAIRPRHLHIAVRDRSHARARLVAPMDEYAESGRGLILVEGMAAAWGCSPTADGKAVWATLRRPTPAAP